MINMINQWRHSVWLRRAIFLSVNLAAALATLNLVILPIHAFFAERDIQIAEQRVLLARLNAMVAQAGTVQEIASKIAATQEHAEFLRGQNEGVMNADLQTRLKAMVQAAGARLRSVRAVPPRTSDEIKFIGAQVEITGPVRAIHQTVYAVESAKPYLFIAVATIKPSPSASARIANGGISAEPTIDAQLDIIGAVQLEGRD